MASWCPVMMAAKVDSYCNSSPADGSNASCSNKNPQGVWCLVCEPTSIQEEERPLAKGPHRPNSISNTQCFSSEGRTEQ